MDIGSAQRDVRATYQGGFVGQLVSGVIWALSAAFATWGSPRHGMLIVVVGGAFIFPLTQLVLRLSGRPGALPEGHPMRRLGFQVAITLPLNLPLVGAATLYRLDWFYPALMVALGAHYVPFAFLYGMPPFVPLGFGLVLAGLALALWIPAPFAVGGWLTAGVLVAFAFHGRTVALRDAPDGAAQGLGVPPKERQQAALVTAAMGRAGEEAGKAGKSCPYEEGGQDIVVSCPR